MTFNEKILSKYIIYPNTHSSLSKWLGEIDSAIKDEPDFLNSDWNRMEILEYYCNEFIEIIPFYCQFPYPSFIDKLTNSKFLKSLKHWVISIEQIENCVDVLVQKYPELNKDIMISITSFYVKMKCTSKVFLIMSKNHKDMKFNINNYFENIKKRIRETPNNVLKSEKSLEDFTSALKGELITKKLKEIPKDKIYTLENYFENKKNTIKSILDFLAIKYTMLYQETYGIEEGQRRMLSMLPGGNYRKILRMIPLDFLSEYNQRELFRDLFNYLKVFAVDENLLSNEEYDEKEVSINNIEDYSYNSYKEYMENKAKIIFGLT